MQKKFYVSPLKKSDNISKTKYSSYIRHSAMKYHSSQFFYTGQQVSSKITAIRTLHLLHVWHRHGYIKVSADIEICIYIISHLKDTWDGFKARFAKQID